MTQFPPCDGPTVKRSVDPPVAKPVASDIVMTNFWVAANGTWTGREPFPLLKDAEGTDTFRGEPKSGASSS